MVGGLPMKNLDAFADNIAYWEDQAKFVRERGEEDLAEAYLDDARDLKRVLEAIKTGDFDTAAKIAFSLDTIVREQIPDSVYRFLQEV
jgi:hypothetical protein